MYNKSASSVQLWNQKNMFDVLAFSQAFPAAEITFSALGARQSRPISSAKQRQTVEATHAQEEETTARLSHVALLEGKVET